MRETTTATTDDQGELQSTLGPTVTSERAPARLTLPDIPAAIAIGSCLGRYTVTSSIGGGGMGEVFSAKDPELGRTVALKVIRPDRLAHSPTARLRLMREAQALARLHHPNVVTVYDIGTEGEQVFLAMELIEGKPLSAWLRNGRHPFREVLAHFLAAGRGLAAAHDAGIIHRDFKPDNVVVGKDRVVVIDFGLARGGDDEAAEGASPRGLLDASLTQTGDRFGTLPYMAPEQLAGARAVPQSDQFAFCVSLWEGLHGERPTDATPEPRDDDVPGWVNDAVYRGLSTDPVARWRSMHELLAELGRDRRAAQNRALLIAAALVLVAAAGWGFLRPTAIDPCTSGATRVAEIWGPAQQHAVHAAFVATTTPGAEDIFKRTRVALDDYAARWATMYGDACRATRVEGRQSDSMMDLRMECLERRRSVLGSLTALWAKGVSADTLEHAADAASNLGSLNDCADARTLGDRAPLPADPGLVVQVKQMRLSVRAFGANDQETLLTTLALAEVARQKGNYDDARKLGEEALAATIEHLGPEHPQVVQALDTLATSSMDANDRERAAQYLRRALAISEKTAGPDSARTGTELHNLGASLQSSGKLEEAEGFLQRALMIREKVLPPDHPSIGATILTLGSLRSQQGRPDEAIELQQRALALWTKAHGSSHPRIAIALHKLGITYLRKGDPKNALLYFQKALSLRIQLLGLSHEMTLFSTALVGQALVDLHRCAEARPLLDETADALAKTVGEDHADFIRTVAPRGKCDLAEGHPAQAVTRMEHAMMLEAGPNHGASTRGEDRFLLARALWAVGRRGEAIEAARRSIEEIAPEPAEAPLVAQINTWLKTHP